VTEFFPSLLRQKLFYPDSICLLYDMTFPIDVIYLHRSYTYNVSTNNGTHFTCIRRLSQRDEDLSAPPEEMLLIKGEIPNPFIWGEYLAGLYTDLMQQINYYYNQNGMHLSSSESDR
jgi:hypothetical protein